MPNELTGRQRDLLRGALRSSLETLLGDVTDAEVDGAWERFLAAGLPLVLLEQAPAPAASNGSWAS
jgi:hypothetical protein